MKKDKIIGHKCLQPRHSAKCILVYMYTSVYACITVCNSTALVTNFFFTVNIINFKCAHTCTCV